MLFKPPRATDRTEREGSQAAASGQPKKKKKKKKKKRFELLRTELAVAMLPIKSDTVYLNYGQDYNHRLAVLYPRIGEFALESESVEMSSKGCSCVF